MKKILSVLTALTMLFSMTAPALAAGDDYTIAVLANGAASASVKVGDTVTVSLTLSKNDATTFDLYAMQDYVRFDPAYFSYVADSVQVYTIKEGEKENAIFAASALNFDGNGIDRVFVNHADTKPQALSSGVEVMRFSLKALQTGTTTLSHGTVEVFQTPGSLFPVTEQTASVTISTGGSGGGTTPGGGGSGGGGGGGTTTEQPKAPVIETPTGTVASDQMDTAVKAADKGETVTVKALEATEATLPVSGMTAAAANDNDVAVDVKNGALVLSAEAISGLTAGAASGANLTVSIEPVEKIDDAQASAQIPASAPVFDVSVLVGDKAVHAFNGTLTVTLTVPNLSTIADPYVLHLLTDNTKEYYKPTVSGNQITVAGLKNLSLFAVIPGDQVPKTLPFTDVAATAWYHDAVRYAYENKLFSGTSDTAFSPDTMMTRGMLVTVLWRMAGQPAAVAASFADVPAGQYYADAVAWASEKEIVGGYGNGKFGPNDTITREQMAAILYRYAKLGGVDVSVGENTNILSYTDAASVSEYAISAVQWSCGASLMQGSDGKLSPQSGATRAQVATILMRYQQNVAK